MQPIATSGRDRRSSDVESINERDDLAYTHTEYAATKKYDSQRDSEDPYNYTKTEVDFDLTVANKTRKNVSFKEKETHDEDQKPSRFA